MRGQCCAVVVVPVFARAALAQQPAPPHEGHAMPSGSHAGRATGGR